MALKALTSGKRFPTIHRPQSEIPWLRGDPNKKWSPVETPRRSHDPLYTMTAVEIVGLVMIVATLAFAIGVFTGHLSATRGTERQEVVSQ
jgi:hypothetical protein